MKQLIYNLIPIVRTFTEDKLVKSKFFNSLGLQAWRMKLAHARYQKKKVDTPFHIENMISEFSKSGILQFDNFLDELEFSQVRQECLDIRKNEDMTRYAKQEGPNMMYNPNIFDLDLEKYPALKKLLTNEKLNLLFSTLEKRPINIANKDIYVQMQYLVQGKDNGKKDPETELHADTFFNTHKAWIYLDDVKEENAPFVFVPTTHNIYLKGRLEKEKAYSKDIGAKGSRRIMQEELDELQLKEKVYTCKKNTLVIANTLGYHRRLRGVDGHDRLTLAFSARSNPFFN